MFEENIGLANYIAYSIYQMNDNLSHEDYKDLKQEALIELWKSSIDYKDMGYKFQTYATKRIRRCLIRAVNDKRIDSIGSHEETYTVDLNKNIMLEEVSKALDKIVVDGDYVKSDIGKYATILKLEGATDTEIANILGSNPSNIKRAIEITVKRLQVILNIKECS
ncbi:MAG: sigma-70 family RNA polymerase sigma factor [Paraclostridium sp.]